MAPRKKTSVLWDHFSESKLKMAKCNYCSQQIAFTAGSLGNLTRNFTRKHPTISINFSNRQLTVSSTMDMKASMTDNENLELPAIKSKSTVQDNI